MKNIATCFFVIFLSIRIISAQSFTAGLSVGGSCGYSNLQTIDLELPLQINVKWKKIKMDATFGINHQPYTINYAERKDLKINKFGFFEEVTIFPFQKYLFIGLRFEYACNWFNKNAIHTLEKHSLYAPNFYIGLGFYGVTGVEIPVSTSISFRMYSVYGVHTYDISNSEIISDGFLYRSIPGKTRNDFKIGVNAGFIIRVSDMIRK
jgi:hypothetical protein